MVRAAFRTAWHRMRPQNPWRDFKGVTLQSPSLTSVMASQGPAAWDMEGWLDVKNLVTHRRLQEVEDELHSRLDELLAAVYAWRDRD